MTRFFSTKMLIGLMVTLLVIAGVLAYYLFIQMPSANPDNTRSPVPNEYKLGDNAVKLLQVNGPQPAVEDQQALLRAMDGLSLNPNTVFSFNEWLKKVEWEGSLTASSATAALLYESAVRLAFGIGERYPHLSLPAFNRAGFDVQIEHGRKDLSIRNSYQHPIFVKVVYNGQIPGLQMWKNPGDKDVVALPRIAIENTVIPFEKVLLDKKRAEGLPAAMYGAGKNGAVIKVFSQTGSAPRSIISRDYYPPQSQFVLKGAATQAPAATAPPIDDAGTIGVPNN